MDESTKEMLEEAYLETVQESLERGDSRETAHKEGVVAAAMFLSAINGLEDEAARQEVARLGFRPE